MPHAALVHIAILSSNSTSNIGNGNCSNHNNKDTSQRTFNSSHNAFNIRTHQQHITKRLPKGFLEDQTNKQQVADTLAKRFHIKFWEDWYNVTTRDIHSRGGAGLLTYYNHSPVRLLKSLYPYYDWQPWKFSQVIAVPHRSPYSRSLLSFRLSPNLSLCLFLSPVYPLALIVHVAGP